MRGNKDLQPRRHLGSCQNPTEGRETTQRERGMYIICFCPLQEGKPSPKGNEETQERIVNTKRGKKVLFHILASLIARLYSY